MFKTRQCMVISEQEKVIMFKFQAPETKNHRSQNSNCNIEQNDLNLESVQEFQKNNDITSLPTGSISMYNESRNPSQVIYNFPVLLFCLIVY